MKLFSRKSLVAAAASTALFAGMVAAPAQAEPANGPEILAAADNGDDGDTGGDDADNTDDDATDGGDDTDDNNDDNADNTPEPEEGSSEQLSSGSSNDEGNLDPGELRDWVAVFTAIIGALSTVFVFMERNF